MAVKWGREQKEALNACIDVDTALSYFGMPYKRGKNFNCLWHNDSSPSCSVTNYGCHCFACGKHVSTIDFIDEYFKQIGAQKNFFREIVEPLAEISGYKLEYIKKGNKTNNKEATSQLPLTVEELGFLGLSTISKAYTVENQLDWNEQYNEAGFSVIKHRAENDTVRVVVKKDYHTSIITLYEEDNLMFIKIVYGKIDEVKKRWENKISLLQCMTEGEKLTPDERLVYSSMLKTCVINYNKTISIENKISDKTGLSLKDFIAS